MPRAGIRSLPVLPLGDMGLLPALCPTDRLTLSPVRPTASGRGTPSSTAQPRHTLLPSPKAPCSHPAPAHPFRHPTGLSVHTELSQPPAPHSSPHGPQPHAVLPHQRTPRGRSPVPAAPRQRRAGELRRSPARGCRRRGAPKWLQHMLCNSIASDSLCVRKMSLEFTTLTFYSELP